MHGSLRTYLLVGAKRSAWTPANRDAQDGGPRVFAGLGPRQFQQRHRLRGVRPWPTRVRPVPPHGHVGEPGGWRRRGAVQTRDVPRGHGGRGAPPERRRGRSGQRDDGPHGIVVVLLYDGREMCDATRTAATVVHGNAAMGDTTSACRTEDTAVFCVVAAFKRRDALRCAYSRSDGTL